MTVNGGYAKISSKLSSIPLFFLLSAPVFAGYSVPLSTPSVRPPSDLNLPRTLRQLVVPGDSFKHDWSARLVFFGDSLGGLPALEIGPSKGKKSLRLLYSDSALPVLADEGSFLRANGVNVKENITSVLIGQSTATYASDAISGFRTRTRSLALYLGRGLYQGEIADISLLAGIGGIYRFYSVDCVLADNSAFRERASSYGLLFSPGLEISLREPFLIKRGFTASLYLIYSKIWLADGDKKLSRPFRKKLETLRAGLGLGWQF